jgi:hypothetical protein
MHLFSGSRYSIRFTEIEVELSLCIASVNVPNMNADGCIVLTKQKLQDIAFILVPKKVLNPFIPTVETTRLNAMARPLLSQITMILDAIGWDLG